MSDNKPNRRELLRPLHLLGIALVCGVFASVVTLVSTGAFTSRVNLLIENGTYRGLTPIVLGLVIGGGAFIVTLLVMSMLILAVDPREYEDKALERPVLYDEEPDDEAASDASSSDAPSSDAPSSDAPSSDAPSDPKGTDTSGTPGA